MKTRHALTVMMLAALLAAAAPSYGQTEWVWTGSAGPASQFFTNGSNWDRMMPPDNDGTADLVFNRFPTMSLTPVMDLAWNVHSVYFDRFSYDPYVILSNMTMTVQEGGITNDSLLSQELNLIVRIEDGVTSSLNANDAPLIISKALDLGGTVNVGGDSTTDVYSVSGVGTINKDGDGALTLRGTTHQYDLVINSGDVNLNAGRGNTATFSSGASIAISSDPGTLNVLSDMTLDGAMLTRAGVGNGLNLAAGTKLTVQNGGSAILTGSGYVLDTAATIEVKDPSSTFVTSAQIAISGGGSFNVSNGASVSCSQVFVDNGTVTVEGVNSTLTATYTGSASRVGFNNATGNLTFKNHATGNLKDVTVGTYLENSTGHFNIQSDADVTVGRVSIGSVEFPGSSGTVTITGTGSTLTQRDISWLRVGCTADSTGLLRVENGGTFTSGTGLTEVLATGRIEIDGGTYNANGDLTLDGGELNCAAGLFLRAAGKTLTIQNGGRAVFAGSLQNTAPLAVTGNTSSLEVGSVLVLWGNDAVNVTDHGAVLAGSVAIDGPTVTVSGSGSGIWTTEPGDTSKWGYFGGTTNLTFSDGAIGSFANVDVAEGTFANTTANVSVLSDANVMVGNLTIAASEASTTGSVSVGGGLGNPVLWQTGASTLTIGAASTSDGSLYVGIGGTFISGTGQITVNKTGGITVQAGDFNANGPVLVDGGALFVLSDAIFNHAPAQSFRVENGGQAFFETPFQPNNSLLTVNGTDSALVVSGAALNISQNSVANVGAGGGISAERLVIGALTNGSLFVSGVNASVSTAIDENSYWGLNANAEVVFSQGAAGALGDVTLGNTWGNGNLAIQSGAQVEMGNLAVADDDQFSAGTITIAAVGSALTLRGASTFSLGASASNGTLTVQEGGAFTSGTGGVYIGPAGVINIDGGTVTLNGAVTKAGTLNFNYGTLALGGDFKVGTGGLLGDTLTLDAARRLLVGGATTIDPYRTFRLEGGAFTTGSLDNQGRFEFSHGTLGITGPAGLTIGSGGPLGAFVGLGGGQTLEVTHTATLDSGGFLVVYGGTFRAGAIDNAGIVDHQAGTFDLGGAFTNQAGGQLIVGGVLSTTGTLSNEAGGRITLDDSAGRISGAGALANAGLITGQGTILKPVNNLAGGELRAEAGSTLALVGVNSPNAGRINLQGGTIEFGQPLTNSATGAIQGRGAANFSGGLTNEGAMNFSGGFTDIFGDVAMTGGAGGSARLIASGGATVTLYDDFMHNGKEVRASVGSNIVFFGDVSGPGTYTGTGTIFYEGTFSPGGSPALVTFGGDVVCGAFATLEMELGGTVRGTQYDALNVAGNLALNGTLNVSLDGGFQPQNGNVFNLFDWGASAGAFSTINLPALIPGLLWDQASLYTAGELQVALDPAFTGRVWDGGGANNDWTTGQNWDLDVEPLSNGTAQLVFAGTMRLAPCNNAVGLQVAHVGFAADAGAFVLGGNAMKIAGKIDDQAIAKQEINVPVEFVAGPNSGTVNVVAGGELEITQPVSGNQGLTKTGLGTLELLQDAAYTGNTDVQAGTLVLQGLTGSGSTTVGGTLIADFIRQESLTIGAGGKVEIRGSGLGPPIASETTADMAPVPEPATWLLIVMTAVAGLIVWGKLKGSGVVSMDGEG